MDTENGLILLLPLGPDQATMLHMKATYECPLSYGVWYPDMPHGVAE